MTASIIVKLATLFQKYLPILVSNKHGRTISACAMNFVDPEDNYGFESVLKNMCYTKDYDSLGLYLISFLLSYADLSDEMLELLFSSVKDLKEMLTNQGSDLLLGFGSTEDFILEVANKVAKLGIMSTCVLTMLIDR